MIRFNTWILRGLNHSLVSISRMNLIYPLFLIDRFVQIIHYKCLLFLAHIMQIFQRRGLVINEDMVKGYLRKYIHTLWGTNAKDDAKKLIKRKIKTTNDK